MEKTVGTIIQLLIINLPVFAWFLPEMLFKIAVEGGNAFEANQFGYFSDRQVGERQKNKGGKTVIR
jgi:hypothetical protein